MERGVPLVEHVISRLSARLTKEGRSLSELRGASPKELDVLESKLMVELPVTFRAFLAFDFTFESLGKRYKGLRRFGTDPKNPKPRITSVRKLAEAMNSWTDSRIRGRVVRLPNRQGKPWSALYLGESSRDGELPILGLDPDDTNVRVFVRYTSFDLYLLELAGLAQLSEAHRLEDIETHIEINPELASVAQEEEDGDQDY